MLLAVVAPARRPKVPGETVVVRSRSRARPWSKEVQVPETVVVEKVVIKTVEVPGETVVVKESV